VVLLGHRPDHLSPDVAAENARIDAAIRAHTAEEIRERGVESAGQEIAAGEPGWPTWLHVDLDVFDEQALPAVTYPQPLGLDWDEFVALLRPLAGAEGVLGVSVADRFSSLGEGFENVNCPARKASPEAADPSRLAC
jgi:arginase